MDISIKYEGLLDINLCEMIIFNTLKIWLNNIKDKFIFGYLQHVLMN